MEQKYRLVIWANGRWRIGITSYTTKQQAEERRQYLISIGTDPKNIKIKTDSEIFDWEG